MLICTRFPIFKTDDGDIPLSAESFTSARIHVTQGIAEWANKSRSNMSRLNQLLSRHANKLARLRRAPAGGKALMTERDFAGADTAHVATEFKGGRPSLSWVAFSSEV